MRATVLVQYSKKLTLLQIIKSFSSGLLSVGNPKYQGSITRRLGLMYPAV